MLPVPPLSAVLWLVACTAWWLQRCELLLPPLLLRAGACACPADRDRAAPCSGLPQQELDRTPLPAWCCVLAERGPGYVCSPPAAGHTSSPPSWRVVSAQRCSWQQPACETNLGGQDLPVWNKNRNVSAHVPRRNLHVYQRRTLSSPRWNGRRVLHGETEHSQRPNVQGWVCKLTCSAVC